MIESSYDLAIQSLSTYFDHIHHLNRREDEALDAIPGYRESRDEAMKDLSGPGVWYMPPALAEKAATVYKGLEDEQAHLQAERTRAVAIFAELTERDIRRMITAFSPGSTASKVSISMVLNIIAASHNNEAVAPLVDRLHAEVIPPGEEEGIPRESRFWRWMWDHVPDLRRLRQTGRELHYSNDRSQTIRALGSIGGHRAEDAIRPFLHDSDEGVRASARKALDRIEAGRYPDDPPAADFAEEK